MAEEKFADEKLSNEELDQVSGGGTLQCCGDAKFLNEMGFADDPNPHVLDFVFRWGVYSKKVDDGWAKAGGTCCTAFGAGDNKYWIGGKPVSRREAFAHVLRQKGYSKDAIANYRYEKWMGAF